MPRAHLSSKYHTEGVSLVPVAVAIVDGVLDPSIYLYI